MSGPPAVLIPLHAHRDARGSLVAVEPGDGALGFEIRRVYYLYDVPDGVARGGHAHRKLRQLMIAVAGRLDVTLDDGRGKTRVTLDDPSMALLVPEMMWRDMDRFAPGTVCLVLASEAFDEGDYIRDYATFLAEVGRRDPHATRS